MSFLSKAFHHIGHALSHGFHDLEHMAKSIVTLDLKGIKDSAHDLVHDAGELARGAISLTPAGLAAQALLQGNYDKIMDKVEGMAEGIVDGVINDMEKFGTGMYKTVDGMVHGRLDEIGKGLLDATLGGASLALDFCPVSAVESTVFKGVESLALKNVMSDVTLQGAKQTLDTAHANLLAPPENQFQDPLLAQAPLPDFTQAPPPDLSAPFLMADLSSVVDEDTEEEKKSNSQVPV